MSETREAPAQPSAAASGGSAVSPDFPEYAADAPQIWNRIAEWWDDRIGDGNDTQDYIVEPVSERLLALRPGERVLDVACGAGRFARRMANAGATVLAVDRADLFLERARTRSAGYEDRIEYRAVDATDEAALLALGEDAFDAVVCTMALMDIAVITPIARAVPRLLRRPRGRFVFSVTHPVFNSGDVRPAVELIEQGTDVRHRYAVSVADYLRARQAPGIGIAGQPEQVHYFHRPISLLLNTFLERGLLLDRLEEPGFPEGLARTNPVSQANFPLLPWVMVARLLPRD
jgi:SAM-dependent methyltransferase